MKIAEIMTEKIISLGQDEPVSAAARLMKRHNIGMVPVCSGGGSLRGVITDRDIVTRCVALGLDPDRTPAREIMSRAIITANPRDDLDLASGLMAREQVRRIPVTEDGRLVGVLALGDLARRRDLSMEAAAALSDISENIRRK